MMATDTTQKLEQVLAQLKDIHYPETPLFWPLTEVLWWPPAPGPLIILLLAAFLVIVLLTKIFKKLKQYYTYRNIHLALQELTNIEHHIDKTDGITIVRRIAILLKKCAIAKYKSQSIQSLSGHDWLKFLNESGNTTEFTSSHGLLIITVPYLHKINEATLPSEKLEQELKKLIVSSKKWIKHNL